MTQELQAHHTQHYSMKYNINFSGSAHNSGFHSIIVIYKTFIVLKHDMILYPNVSSSIFLLCVCVVDMGCGNDDVLR